MNIQSAGGAGERALVARKGNTIRQDDDGTWHSVEAATINPLTDQRDRASASGDSVVAVEAPVREDAADDGDERATLDTGEADSHVEKRQFGPTEWW